MKALFVAITVLLVSCATAPPPAPPPAPANDAPGYLGFSFEYRPPEGGESGWVLVKHIHPDSPALAAGLEPQMVITAINGRALDFTEDLDLIRLIGTIRPRDRVRLALGGQHSGRELTVVAAEMSPEALRRWRANFEGTP